MTGFVNVADDVHPNILPNGLSIAAYNLNSKNTPSNYGVVLYMSHNNDMIKWNFAIAFPTESLSIFISSKINEKNWSDWIAK